MGDRGLKFGAIERAVHLCTDMQRLFAEETPWHTPWMKRILPQVCAIAERHGAQTVFTRFVTPKTPNEAPGAWRRYYERWHMMTRDRLDPELLSVMPELSMFIPPAQIFDKQVYSPWQGGQLHAQLHERGCHTLVMTGGETDVCLMAGVAGAIDLGYRVIVVRDAICGSRDDTHDEMLDIYKERYDMQVEVADTEEVLAAWRRDA